MADSLAGSEHTRSVWAEGAGTFSCPPVQGRIEADVAIVGGGLTGLLTAQALIGRGLRIAVVEAGAIGASNTGRSTGNLYSTMSSGLAQVRSKWGADVTAEVVDLRTRAIAWLEALAADLPAEARIERVPLYLAIGADRARLHELDEEVDALRGAGLDVDADATQEFPFRVERALRLAHQAQCNPLALARALARRLHDHGVMLFERSRVVDADAGDGRLELAQGEVVAPQLVFATHTPKGFNLVQAEMEVYREHGVALHTDTPWPAGTYWVRDDGRSLRRHAAGGRDYVVVVGEKHKTGEPPSHDPRAALADYVQQRWQVQQVSHRWSAQQYAAADKLPYIGRSAHDNVYVATGFAADGLTWGAVAAGIVADLVGGHETAASKRLTPRRFTPIKSAAGWGRENASVVKHMTVDYLQRPDASVPDLAPDQGCIAEVDGHARAVYRKAGGEVVVLSCVCPHLKCKVAWNGVDRTWDCPCHGSRFDAVGRVIEGPAWTDLETIAVHPARGE